MPDKAGRQLALARAFRLALLREERAAASEMVQAYRWAYARIQVQMARLLEDYERALASNAPKPVMRDLQRDMRQADSLQGQIVREMRHFGDIAESIVTEQQSKAVRMGQTHAEQLTLAGMGPAPEVARVVASFNKVPTDALKDLVGFTVKGAPLRGLFDAMGEDVSEAARRTLLSGFTLGYSPRKIADEMTANAGIGLDRALRISRTETLRAYRESTRRAYAANPNMVKGWIWLSAADLRTCAACWAMHGTHHTADEVMDDHPNGRCTMLAEPKTWAELGFPGIDEVVPQIESGPTRFGKLDASTQREILGRAAYEAYRDGAVRLEDFVGQRYSPDWGSMRYARSLVSMVGLEESLRYREMARGGD